MELSFLYDHGINYKAGLARCMGNQVLYEKLLRMFLQDQSFSGGKAALLRGDYPAMFQCMHELKGSCGNTDMTRLYEAVCPLVELLRHKEVDAREAALLFQAVESAYASAREGILLALGESPEKG